MDRLWSPWRSRYVAGSKPDGDGCFLCGAREAGGDVDAQVVHRGDAAFVILNAYPYNNGHLMVAPNRHVGELEDLEAAERGELMELAMRSVSLLKQAMGPDGFNLGVNLGGAAGAGVPGHLHVHVVPRWGGDTNFMPVVGETKVLPEMLADTDAKLRPLFESGAGP